jgi:hypothetical protein
MLNPFKDVNWNPGRAEKRKFAVSLIIGFPAIAIFLSIVGRLTAHTWKPFFFWLGIVGLTAGIVLWLLPIIARPFYAVWYFIACCMGFIMGNVLFSVFYFLVLTPLGLLMRMAGRDPLKKKFDRKTSTYWEDAEKVVDLNRYYRQF